MPVEPGDRLGPYEIVSHLGGGGMGLVYKARDTRLDRLVAIKLLPPELSRDEAAKERFVQEAKAASALDHPGICTIYEIGETPDGQLYLAMAYYEGETLKESLTGGPLAIDQAIDLAIQVAEGLAEAHASGIIHRDIKPPNLMLSKAGQVKIVDFGIAKLAGQTGPTEIGTAVGTVAYMSPEQCRADEVDPRTDIWSLGVVLYEMVAGQPPFHGDHYFAVASAIARNEVTPLSGTRAGVPLGLERVVHRALAKDPADRYQTASDFAADLRGFREEMRYRTSDLTVTEARPSAPSKPKPYPIAWVATLLLLVAMGGYLFLRDRGGTTGAFRLANAVQVTSALGVEDYPTWSPDSRTLAYAANLDSDLYGGNWDVWVTEIGGGEPVNRTSDHPGDDRFPVWSPDGLQIAFWSDREGRGYFVMPAIGGTPRKVIATPGETAADLSRPQWSSDGGELATVAYDNNQVYLEVVPLRAGEPRRFSLPVRNKALDISWSPDGSRMAYVDGVNLSSQVSQLGILDLRSGDTVVLTDGRHGVWSPHWSPNGEAVFYVSNLRGSMDLWEQRLHEDGTPSDPARPVSSGVGMIRAAVSPEGTKLAYSRGQRVANLWRVPIFPDRPASWVDATQMTFDQAFIEFVDVSVDGQRVLVASDRAGNSDVWMLPGAGGEMQQMTTGSVPEWAPRWSPDGESIVFYSYENGNRDIWLMSAAGGPARQLTESEAEDFVPAWSPDGEQIAFTSLRSGNPDIWVTPAQGGVARPLTEHPGEDRRPHWSPDGKWLAFVSSRSGELRVWRVPADGGPAEPLTKGAAYYPRWSPDGNQIYFTGWADRSGNLWEISLRSGAERAVTDLSGRPGSIGDLALATDGDYLYFTWEEDIGNIWVMDVLTDE